jgi:hypothetical protein
MDSLALIDTAIFVRSLPPPTRFNDAFDNSTYVALPEDWYIVLTDVVKSREAIAQGRYKAVNVAGVAMISAVMNDLNTRDIPFIFGGDGAAIAIAPSERAIVADVLARVVAFARQDLDLELRAAMIPLSIIRQDGFDVQVESVRLSDALNQYAFIGGGLSYAEKLMKQGRFAVSTTTENGKRPDLTGLSCRWTPITAPGKKIVSLIVEPGEKTGLERFYTIARQLLTEFGFEADSGNPMPPDGPDVKWPVDGIELEARASRGNRNIRLVRTALYVKSMLAWLVFTMGIPVGKFDPKRYRRYTSLNTDFRKVQDGLRMTLSMAESDIARVNSLLEEKRATGQIRYGIFVQDSALLTCFVPSLTEDSHFHFLDGANGGYAAAAANMRD